jgi:two-component system nitrogen regulation sensor histidine kinase GlnL
MNVIPLEQRVSDRLFSDGWAVLDMLPDAVLALDRNKTILWANSASEQVFGAGRNHLVGRTLDELLGPGSALSDLCALVSRGGHSLREHELHLGLRPPLRGGTFDVQIVANAEAEGHTLVCLRQHGLNNRLGELSNQRGAARSLAGLAASLAHEVKNPLSGIRGAAQLLGVVVDGEDRELASLIAEEVDRICALLDRMEAFSDRHPMPRERLNIHEVLDHVARLARAGVAANLKLVEVYDPSLPEIEGNRDALIQAVLNLVKNAAEACGPGGVITLGTAYDGSVRQAIGSDREAALLPLIVTVEDNGPGIPADLREHLFEPFVSGSETRSGLGLSLVAKIIDNHGGAVSTESSPEGTVFRIALPLARSGDRR